MVIEATVTIELDFESAILDIMSEEISIPKLGVRLTLNTTYGQYEIIGLCTLEKIIADPNTSKDCPQFEIIAQNPLTKLYQDLTNKDKNVTDRPEHPDILVVSRDSKHVALQRLESVTVCHRHCRKSQVPDVLICNRNPDDTNLTQSLSLFNELESEGLFFTPANQHGFDCVSSAI